MTHTVCYGKCTTYEPGEVETALARTLECFGGWEKALPPPPASILVKPNLLAGFPPEKNVTTHPAVVRAVIKSLRSSGYGVVVGDSPAPSLDGVREIFEVTGIGPVCEEMGVEWISFDAAGYRCLEGINPIDPKLHLALPVLEADAVVNLPKFKTHSLTFLTAGVKNLFGYVPGMRKTELHQKALHPGDFALIVADIARARPPEITILDGVTAMHGNGPNAGRPYPFERLAMSDNAAALDHSLGVIIGMKLHQLPIEAACLQYGLFDPEAVEERGDVPPCAAGFELPGVYRVPRLPISFGRFLAELTRFFPEIRHGTCSRCGLCARSCPNGAIYRESGEYIIDYGRCITCMCCHEICPTHAVELTGTAMARAFLIVRRLRRRLGERKKKRVLLLDE